MCGVSFIEKKALKNMYSRENNQKDLTKYVLALAIVCCLLVLPSCSIFASRDSGFCGECQAEGAHWHPGCYRDIPRGVEH